MSKSAVSKSPVSPSKAPRAAGPTVAATRTRVDAWCLKLPHATLEFPFGDDTAVYKVGGKLFALQSMAGAPSVSLKVVPDDGVALRAQYPCVTEGYHLNKRHWITIDLDGDIPGKVVRECIEDSYRLVGQGLTRKVKDQLGL